MERLMNPAVTLWVYIMHIYIENTHYSGEQSGVQQRGWAVFSRRISANSYHPTARLYQLRGSGRMRAYLLTTESNMKITLLL